MSQKHGSMFTQANPAHECRNYKASAKGDHIAVEIRGNGKPTTTEEETADNKLEVNSEEEPKMPRNPWNQGT